MLNLPDKISFRPGALAGPLAEWCETKGRTPSEAIRVALSRMLRVKQPDMKRGNPEFGKDDGESA